MRLQIRWLCVAAILLGIYPRAWADDYPGLPTPQVAPNKTPTKRRDVPPGWKTREGTIVEIGLREGYVVIEDSTLTRWKVPMDSNVESLRDGKRVRFEELRQGDVVSLNHRIEKQ